MQGYSQSSSNVPEGKYLLSVESPSFNYEKILVEILEDAPRFFYYNETSKARSLTRPPLIIYPVDTYQFFEQREKFNPWSLLTNGYVIMIGVSVLMLVMVKNMPSMGKKRNIPSW